MLIALTGLAACRTQPERADLLVFAAASLTDMVAEVETRFEAAHPETDVLLSAIALESPLPLRCILSMPPLPERTLDRTAVRRTSLREAGSDVAYWRARPPHVRLQALEGIRREYHDWPDDAGPRLQRVCRVRKRP